MDNNHIHFVGVCGSLRQGSFNNMLLNEAVNYLPSEVSMEIISIKDIPLYNADLDLPTARSRPEPVVTFRDRLSKADGLVIVSPEYNYSIPGGLKNAIDWASRGEDSPLLRKPVALMGATSGLWGTTRMQMSFHNVFLFLDMKPVYKPEVLIAQADKKFDQNGKLTDEPAKKFLKQKLQALKEMVLLYRPAHVEG